jgi:hypothetical protein
MEGQNPWGEFAEGTVISTPVQVLREYAAKLGVATERILEGRVDMANDASKFQALLIVAAPLLDNYMFTILRVEYAITSYPAKIYNLADRNTIPDTAEDEQHLRTIIERILASRDVRRVVISLYSQSRQKDS